MFKFDLISCISYDKVNINMLTNVYNYSLKDYKLLIWVDVFYQYFM